MSRLDPAFKQAYEAGHQLMHQQLQARLSAAGKGVLISNNAFIPQVSVVADMTNLSLLSPLPLPTSTLFQ